MTQRFNSINVYISRQFSEYGNAIKQTISNWSTLILYHPIDGSCRTENREILPHSDLSIILMNDGSNDRYGSSANWLKCMIKNIDQNSTNVLVIIYGDINDWIDYEKILDSKIKVECVRWLINDDNNISVIEKILTNYNI